MTVKPIVVEHELVNEKKEQSREQNSTEKKNYPSYECFGLRLQ